MKTEKCYFCRSENKILIHFRLNLDRHLIYLNDKPMACNSCYSQFVK